MSLHCGEDTSSFENLFDLSFVISKSIEGEYPYFSTTPLHDSSNYQDAKKHPEFFDLGCRGLSTYSYDHDVDSTIVNLSRTMVYDDLSVDEVETPQTVEALQPKLMVMSGPHFLEVGFMFDKEIVETIEAPHHSLLCIYDQSNTQISLPPLELHDPIAHALEESYTTSTLAQHKWSTFLTFSCMSRLRECIHSTFACSVAQHHGNSTECMSCAFTHFFFYGRL